MPAAAAAVAAPCLQDAEAVVMEPEKCKGAPARYLMQHGQNNNADSGSVANTSWNLRPLLVSRTTREAIM
jgi:hypothetical protein